jgi:hypothetical protein
MSAVGQGSDGYRIGHGALGFASLLSLLLFLFLLRSLI